jgi:hypothetical protein
MPPKKNTAKAGKSSQGEKSGKPEKKVNAVKVRRKVL